LTPAFCASFLDSILSPIAAIALGGGPMKAIFAFERLGEALALGQEAVAGCTASAPVALQASMITRL
jgi:hypothetical protein